MANVVLERVSKHFGTVRVIESLDLHVEDKEFLVLVGPSGCGKSTVLRLAILRDDGMLAAPKLGVFVAQVSAGDVVRPGDVLGILEVLNRRYRVVAPSGAAGIVLTAPEARHQPVGYGDELIRLGELSGLDIPAARTVGPDGAAIDGVAVSAPITGIFYRRAAPSTPVYVELGQAVATGQTVGLIEVMKSFNPVVYTGTPGVVVSIPAGDRQEVAAGQPLVVVRPG